MISRRDDEDVLNILRGGATKKSAIFEIPCGRADFIHLLCCSSLTYIQYASLLNALNVNKIDSAQVMLILILLPLVRVEVPLI